MPKVPKFGIRYPEILNPGNFNNKLQNTLTIQKKYCKMLWKRIELKMHRKIRQVFPIFFKVFSVGQMSYFTTKWLFVVDVDDHKS